MLPKSQSVRSLTPKQFGAFLSRVGGFLSVMRFLTLVLLFIFISYTAVFARDSDREETASAGPTKVSYTFVADGSGGPHQLPHGYLLFGTVQVFVDGEELLVDKNYVINHDLGSLTFTGMIPSAGDEVEVRYLYFPLKELFGDRTEPEGEVYAPGAGGKLEVTGSKSFTVTAQSGGDITLDQATRINFEGMVGQVTIEGRLSDEQLPLVPEGKSEELAEIDEVYVHIEGPGFRSTLGDIRVKREGTAFCDFDKHLLGVTAGGEIAGQEFGLSLARAKGKHHTQELTAIEGVQGPYVLAVPDQAGISVIPASERVFLNGELMLRGETNDYIIDYTTPSITFTTFRPLSVDDRIVVEFEYTQLGYRRTFFDSAARFFTPGRSLGAFIYFTQESDDRDEDLVGLTDDERDILAQAGDDPSMARVQAYDSDGNPLYTYVGKGNGDYIREWDPDTQSYVYIAVGQGNGDWKRTMISLPMPKKHQLANIGLTYSPSSLFNFSAELATSDLDRNLFSDVDDEDNIGYALKLNLLSGFRIGRLKLTFSPDWLSRDSEFAPLEGLEDAEFRRQWEMEGDYGEGEKQPSLELFGGTVGFDFAKKFFGEVGYQGMERRYPHSYRLDYDLIKARKLNIKGGWDGGGDGGFDFNLRRLTETTYWTGGEPWEYWSQEMFLSGKVLDWSADGNHRISIFRPGISGGQLVKKGELGGMRLVKGVDRRYVRPRLDIVPFRWLSTSFAYRIYREKAVEGGGWVPYSRGNEYFTAFTITSKEIFYWQANYLRKTTYFEDINLADIESDLVRSQMRFSPLGRALTANIRYNASSNLDFEREEVFEVAEDRNGDYRREPDPDDPDRWIYIYDPDHEDAIYIRILRPSGASFRVLDVEGYLGFTLDLSQLLAEREDEGGLLGLLSQMRWDVALSTREKSTDEDHFRVLTFLSRLGEDTVYGSLSQSYSLTLFPMSSIFSPTIGYEDYESLDNQVTNQTKWTKRRGFFLRVFSSPYPRVELTGRVEVSRELARYSSLGLDIVRTSRRDTLSVELTPRYRPLPGLTLSVELGGDFIRQWDDCVYGTIKAFSAEPKGVIKVTDAGTLSLGYFLEKVVVDNAYGSKFLITHPEGISHRWSASYRHQLSNYLTATLGYGGKREAGRAVEHKATMDFSAYF